jgi:hypothetical protein
MTGTGYYGHLAITLGEVRGVPSGDVSLEVQLKMSVDGFAPGVAAMILAACHAQGARSSVVLGQAEPIIVQLGFAPARSETSPSLHPSMPGGISHRPRCSTSKRSAAARI